jgi:hypothetical protein
MPSLTDLLTQEQQTMLAEKLAQVIESGYGELTVTVQNSHVRFIRVQSSHEMPAPEVKEEKNEGD